MKMRNLLVLLAVLCLFGACKNSGKYEPVNNNAASTADTVATDPEAEKLVRTAEMSMKVKNVPNISERIVGLTSTYHGMVMNHHMRSEEVRSQDMPLTGDSLQRVSVFHTTADLTVKVPSDSLERFMTTVGKMGLYVNTRRMDIEDKTLDYLSSQLKLNSRTQLISQQKTGKVIIKKPGDVLALKDDMIDEKINNKRIDDAVKNSVVQLSLYQSDTIIKEHIANDDPGAYQMPFFSRLTFSLVNGWGLFTGFVVGLANLWVFVLIGLVIWFVLTRYYKRKALPAAANI